jgi:hypothetical protein
MLALGKDEALKLVAKQELEGVASSTEQAKLGDGWWNLAENGEGATKKQMQARAGYWYQKALPSLSGIMKDKVEKRIQNNPITTTSRQTITGLGKFEGVWIIHYTNGTGRRYVIDSAGTVKYGSQIATLKVKDGEVLLDFSDGKLERLTLGNQGLHIEHFNPANLYPTKTNATAQGRRLVKQPAGAKQNYRTFQGIWTIKYSNGASRVYSITAAGLVVFPAEKHSGKLVMKDGETVLDFGDGAIERLEVDGRVLQVDHHAPASDYPHFINLYGVGVKSR